MPATRRQQSRCVTFCPSHRFDSNADFRSARPPLRARSANVPALIAHIDVAAERAIIAGPIAHGQSGTPADRHQRRQCPANAAPIAAAATATAARWSRSLEHARSADASVVASSHCRHRIVAPACSCPNNDNTPAVGRSDVTATATSATAAPAATPDRSARQSLR